MKKIKKAFTMVELIVVSSIIILLSASSVFYFGDFLDNYKLSGEISRISSSFNRLDEEVKTQKIFDYSLNLNTGSGEYIVYKNIFDLKNYTGLSVQNGTGVLNINPPINGTWTIRIYKGDKFVEENTVNSNSSYKLYMGDSKNYKVISYLSGVIINEVELNYFSRGNIDPSKQDLIFISAINSKQDKSGTAISKLNIKNIGGKKTIIGDGTDYDEVYVFFEMLGKTDFIKITKN